MFDQFGQQVGGGPAQLALNVDHRDMTPDSQIQGEHRSGVSLEVPLRSWLSGGHGASAYEMRRDQPRGV
jgi:hypothetical protein